MNTLKVENQVSLTQNILDNEQNQQSNFQSDLFAALAFINNPENQLFQSPQRDDIISSLNLITETLDQCQNIQEINPHVIEQVLQFGDSKDEEILNKVIDIINFITISNDETVSSFLYLQPPFIEVLLNLISTNKNPMIITESLIALNELTSNKPKTLKALDGENFYKISFFLLSRIRNKKTSNKAIGSFSIHRLVLSLLCNCLCHFSAPDTFYIQSKTEIMFLLDGQIEYKRNFAMSLLSKISYFQAGVVLSYFSEEIVRYVPMMASGASFHNDFVESLFGALNNMVVNSDEFAISILQLCPLFDIPFNVEMYNSITLLNFFRLEYSIFHIMLISDKNNTHWIQSFESIQAHSVDIIRIALAAYFNSSFTVKKVIVLMICSLLQIICPDVILQIFSTDLPIIETFADIVTSVRKYDLILRVTETLLFLCHLAQNNDQPSIIQRIIDHFASDELIENIKSIELSENYDEIMLNCREIEKILQSYVDS